MRARFEPLQIPQSPRYFAVEIEGRDVHHFRMPPPEHAYKLGDWWAADEQAGELTGMGISASHLRVGAALVGFFWWHRGQEMQAVRPLILDDESLRRYSLEVQEELTDAGYSVLDIKLLSLACKKRLGAFLRESEGIEEVLGNGGAPGDETVSL